VLEGACKENATSFGHAQAFLRCNALQVGFDYGVHPEDEVNGLALGTPMFFCSSSFGVQRLRSRGFWERFRLEQSW
jgi:hypothetical protein